MGSAWHSALWRALTQLVILLVVLILAFFACSPGFHASLILGSLADCPNHPIRYHGPHWLGGMSSCAWSRKRRPGDPDHLTPRNGQTLIVGIVARISGC